MFVDYTNDIVELYIIVFEFSAAGQVEAAVRLRVDNRDSDDSGGFKI